MSALRFICLVVSIVLVFGGRDGWGWFLFAAVII